MAKENVCFFGAFEKQKQLVCASVRCSQLDLRTNWLAPRDGWNSSVLRWSVGLIIPRLRDSILAPGTRVGVCLDCLSFFVFGLLPLFVLDRNRNAVSTRSSKQIKKPKIAKRKKRNKKKRKKKKEKVTKQSAATVDRTRDLYIFSLTLSQLSYRSCMQMMRVLLVLNILLCLRFLLVFKFLKCESTTHKHPWPSWLRRQTQVLVLFKGGSSNVPGCTSFADRFEVWGSYYERPVPFYTRPYGPMDKAPAYGAVDSGFESL